MEAFVTALVAAFTPALFWAQLTSLVPFIAIIAFVALGYRMVKKLIKGASKAKVSL